MRNFTDEEVQKLADLSSLSFSNEELQKMKNDLMQTFSFVEKIENESTNSAPASVEAVSLSELREDVAQPGITNEEAIMNAPKSDNGCYVVPKVVD